MNPNKALWEKGDFTRIAAAMRESGDELIADLGIGKGLQVLDLGCGDGTTALPAAVRGADVLGVDIADNLVAAGNARAKAAGLPNLRFEVGDASDLENLRDHSFDRIVTMFGAMFAPRPNDVAKEMVRVSKPGGRIVMGNWIPGDPSFISQVLKISGSYSPPPPEGFVSPVTWGVEANVIDRFGSAGIASDQITCTREAYTFNYSGTPEAFLNDFRNYYGPTMNAFDAATKDGRADDLHRDLLALFQRENHSQVPDRTSISATYLRVTVSV